MITNESLLVAKFLVSISKIKKNKIFKLYRSVCLNFGNVYFLGAYSSQGPSQSSKKTTNVQDPNFDIKMSDSHIFIK